MNFAHSVYPIARTATLVRHGNHHDFVLLNGVNQGKGKVIDAQAACIGFDTPANTRMLSQQAFGNHNLPAEVTGG